MTTENLFSDPSKEIDPEEAYNSLVGEDKKYKDDKQLAKAAVHKDQFIEQLQRELEQSRALVKSQEQIEDLFNKAKTPESEVTAQSTPANGENTNGANTPAQQQIATPQIEDVEKRVQEMFEAKQAELDKQNNVENVIKVARETLGEDFKTVLATKAAEQGFSQERFVELAENDPAMAISVVKSMRPSASSQHSDNSSALFNQGGPGSRPGSSVSDLSNRSTQYGETYSSMVQRYGGIAKAVASKAFAKESWEATQKYGTDWMNS